MKKVTYKGKEYEVHDRINYIATDQDGCVVAFEALPWFKLDEDNRDFPGGFWTDAAQSARMVFECLYSGENHLIHSEDYARGSLERV